jgi:hypothetical protein
MENLALRAPDVNSDAPGPPPRRRRLPAGTRLALAVLILFLATACDSSPDRSPATTGSTYLVLSIGALVVAVVILNAVGKLMGQIFDVTLKLLKVFAAVGFTTALVIAAVILAIVATVS